MQYSDIFILAAAYGEGSYNASTYSDTTTTSTGTPVNTGNQTGGSLANTGFEVLAIVTVACFIVFAALIVRFWRRRQTKTPTA